MDTVEDGKRGTGVWRAADHTPVFVRKTIKNGNQKYVILFLSFFRVICTPICLTIILHML